MRRQVCSGGPVGCGHTRCDKIKYEDIQDKVGVTFMVDKMRQVRLRWFGYVKRCGAHPSEEVER